MAIPWTASEEARLIAYIENQRAGFPNRRMPRTYKAMGKKLRNRSKSAICGKANALELCIPRASAPRRGVPIQAKRRRP
jgi:hypothetical protein